MIATIIIGSIPGGVGFTSLVRVGWFVFYLGLGLANHSTTVAKSLSSTMPTGYTTLSNTYQVRGGGNDHTVGMLPYDQEASCSNRSGKEVWQQRREAAARPPGDQIRYSVLATGGLLVTTVYSSCDFQAGDLRELSPQVDRWRAERGEISILVAGAENGACRRVAQLLANFVYQCARLRLTALFRSGMALV